MSKIPSIECLIPPEIPPRPKCCATVTRGKYSRKESGTCGVVSSYLIDGQPYCKKHAGEAALRVLICAEEK